jgi:hypothetical protein
MGRLGRTGVLAVSSGNILSYALWPVDYYYRSGRTALSRATIMAAMPPRTTIATDMATALVAYRTSTGTTESDIAATPDERATKKP